MNELKIRMTQELMDKIRMGNLKSIELVKFILNTVSGSRTEKQIEDTALEDIYINDKYVINAKIDMYYEELVIILSKDSNKIVLSNGDKFTDGRNEYEIIEYITRNNLYRVRNYTENRENQLMKEEEIKVYINDKEYYEERLIRTKQRKIEIQLQEEKELAETERKQKEYEHCYGFVDGKTKLQQGKILKTLNKKMAYQRKIFTIKGFIEHITKIHPELTIEEFFNTNRYSKKKINGCYEKLVDKMEYYAWWSEDGRKTGVILQTKTEYDYCKYLLDNKIKVA